MINIVVPMAGRGSRFAGHESDTPKPLIEVVPGRLMIDFVVDYLRLSEPHRFIFVCLADHLERYDLASRFGLKGIDFDIVVTQAVTRGPAETALLARRFIAPGEELLVAYCDCYLTIDPMDFVGTMRGRQADGGLLVYPSSSPSNSYAELLPYGSVVRTAEKRIVSPHATAGLYYFKRGADFVDAAEIAVAAHRPGDQEPFVCPLFNQMIARGLSVMSMPLALSDRIEMGTPADLLSAREVVRKEARP